MDNIILDDRGAKMNKKVVQIVSAVMIVAMLASIVSVIFYYVI